MVRSFLRAVLREIRQSLGRYLAILAIVALGVGFFAGLRASQPSMMRTGIDYIEAQRLYDFRVLSTLGFTEEDVAALGALDGVAAARGAVYADFLAEREDGETQVLRVHSLTEDIDIPRLVSGRMPERGDECLADARRFTEDDLGTVIAAAAGNDEDTLDLLRYDEYTVVGTAYSPYYLNYDRGSSSVGGGSVAAFLYIPEEGFDFDAYYEVYLAVEDPEEPYSDAYDEHIEAMEPAIEALTDQRAEKRYEDICADAMEEIGDAEAELAEGRDEYERERADAEAELADAKRELDDGEAEYADGLRTYEDAVREYEDGLAAYEDGQQELADARAELDGAKQELDDARAELDDAKQELAGARAELDDGWAEYYDGKAEAERELADARRELQDGEAEYADGYQAYEDAVREYEDGLAAYEDGLEEYEDGLAEYRDGREQLEEARAELDAAAPQLEAARTALEESRAALDEGYAGLSQLQAEIVALEQQAGAASDEQIPALQAQLAALQATYDQTAAQLQEGQAQYDAGLAEYETQKAAYDQGEAEYRSGVKELDEAREQLRDARAELDAAKEELDAAPDQLADARAELEAARAELDDGWAAYYDGRAEAEQELAGAKKTLDDGEADYAEGLKEYEDGEADYAEGLKEYEDGEADYAGGLTELRDAAEELDAARADLSAGKQELSDARSELDDGWAAYGDAADEAQAEFDDAEKELDDGQAEIDDAYDELRRLKTAVTYILTRDENAGYVSFESDTSIVAAVSVVFPVFFFLVAALVCMTTMTRMVDEQRTQIGVLKALGYGNGFIMGKYVFYAGSAATAGSVLGYAAGVRGLPWILWRIYDIIYGFAPLTYEPLPALFAVSFAAALLCSAGTTFLSCRLELGRQAAELIRPKAPRPGRRVFLERLTPVWRRLSFLHKVSVRNVLRYRSRLMMMVLGIGGCTALLVTGFGIRDSIASVADDQFDEISLYDYAVFFQENVSPAGAEDYLVRCGLEADQGLPVRSGSADIVAGNGSKSVYLVISSEDTLAGFVDLHDGEGPVAYPAAGEAVVNNGLAKKLGLSVGDSVKLHSEDLGDVTVTVSGVADNYVYNYVYVSQDTYREQIGNEVKFNALYVRGSEGADPYAEGAALLDDDSVSSVTVNAATRDWVDNMLSRMNYIVAVIVVCAAALAFIVLVNLTNINITERVREIATIKVLGFYQNETAAYVFREINILSVLGGLAGLPMGKALHAFVMGKIQIDAMFFSTRVSIWSYLISFAMTMAFTLLISLTMRPRIRAIDMAESLKSVE